MSQVSYLKLNANYIAKDWHPWSTSYFYFFSEMEKKGIETLFKKEMTIKYELYIFFHVLIHTHGKAISKTFLNGYFKLSVLFYKLLKPAIRIANTFDNYNLGKPLYQMTFDPKCKYHMLQLRI